MVAATQVFETNELLEMVLQNLPPRTLLLAQRINKKWQNVISSSTKLQQLLFFKALPGHRVFASDAKIEYGTIIKNPLLRSLLDSLSDDILVVDPKGPSGQRLIEQRVLSQDPRIWARKEASWRHMLPTQPSIHPCFKIGLMIKYDPDLDPDEESEEERKPGDMKSCRKLRMGDIIDEVSGLVYAGLHGSSGVNWAKFYDHTSRFDDLESYDQLEQMIAYRKHYRGW